jgi:PAS domain S-box-containing protein
MGECERDSAIYRNHDVTMDDITDKAIAEHLLGPDLGIEIIKHSQHGFIGVNADGLIILVNRSAELMFGYHKSELIGKALEILLPDSLKEKHKEHRSGFMDRPRDRPMGVGLPLKAKHKDGSEISIDINLIPVPTVKGLIVIAEISRKDGNK